MFVEELRHKIGSFLKSLLLNGKDQEIESLKRENRSVEAGAEWWPCQQRQCLET